MSNIPEGWSVLSMPADDQAAWDSRITHEIDIGDIICGLHGMHLGVDPTSGEPLVFVDHSTGERFLNGKFVTADPRTGEETLAVHGTCPICWTESRDPRYFHCPRHGLQPKTEDGQSCPICRLKREAKASLVDGSDRMAARAPASHAKSGSGRSPWGGHERPKVVYPRKGDGLPAPDVHEKEDGEPHAERHGEAVDRGGHADHGVDRADSVLRQMADRIKAATEAANARSGRDSGGGAE